MLFKVPTSRRQVAVKIDIEVPGEPFSVRFVGIDPHKKNTKYFDRSPRIHGRRTMYFSLPRSPEMLYVRITGSGTFKVHDVHLIPLRTEANEIDQRDKANIRFIENFSRNCGYLRAPRVYRSHRSDFVIQFLPSIRVNGAVHPTPARIHKKKNHIQVSKAHFDKMTVPMRVAILLHEYSHNYYNEQRDSEMEADYHAMNVYSMLGYPYSEAVKAYAMIFSDTDINFQRIDKIYSNLKEHWEENSIL